jgi:Na+-translocating ferredoxin:NAD+ oxidoreductase subunit D
MTEKSNIQRNFVVTSSPHLKGKESIRDIMRGVVFSLIPVVLASVYIFKLQAIKLIVVSVVTCVITEKVILKLRKKPTKLTEGSAVITGILFALTLPPTLPIYAVILGSVVSIAIGKMVFGGLGYNIFNPALVGRAFLMATYPVLMTSWIAPVKGWLESGATSSATPLAMMKFSKSMTSSFDLIVGNVGGSLGETSVIAILIGAAFLLYKRYIDWRMPVSYIGSTFIFGWILYLFMPSIAFPPLFHVFSGGLVLGAFFMATDMVTSPITPRGNWVFGIGAGLLVVLIRVFGGLPEGVMYSILFMNALTPLINKYTKPKLLGEKKQ